MTAFDPDFYLDHYGDLRGIRTHKQARRHYVRHGKAEGRFANQWTYLQSLAGDLRAGFDAMAYRHFNKDVAQHFTTDDDLFDHYLRHGHKEGRTCRFPGNGRPAEVIPAEERWKALFSPLEFLAWCGGELDRHPHSRAEALELFEREGIDRLWPISLDYRFDVDFVRENRLVPFSRDAPDGDVYRTWLCQGVPAGIAPNETRYLEPYLHGAPFPPSFDWQTFAQRTRLPRGTTRSGALIALFDQSAQAIIRDQPMLGGDAAWLLQMIARRALAAGQHGKAIPLLEQCILTEPTAERLTLLGDALRQAGKTGRALEAYAQACTMVRAPFSAFLGAIDIHTQRRNFADAFSLIRKAHPRWRELDAFDHKLEELVQLHFEHASAQAHALYREAAAEEFSATLRAQADVLLAGALDVIRTAYLQMGAMPAKTGGVPDGHVAILANDDLRQCTHYRVEQKAMQFAQAGLPVRIFSHSDVGSFVDSLVGARAAIFYRVAAVPEVLKAILVADAMGLETFYEIDDLIFDPACYPDRYETFEGQISLNEYTGLQFGVPLFRYALASCSSYIASTTVLAVKMQEVVSSAREADQPAGPGVILRNGLDPRNDEAVAMGAHPLRSMAASDPAPRSGKVRVFYGSGTKAHNADFNTLVGPALLKLMHLQPEVELVIVGHLQLMPALREMKDRVRTYPFTPDLAAYWSILASCDINLAVLEPGIMADCKSEIKWLEAAILQVPSVMSPTRTYQEVIEPDVDGLFAETPTRWHDALHRLVTQPQLRQQIGAAARAKALRDYSLRAAADTLHSRFAPTLSTATPHSPRRLRVLICNVFFAPQSYGGATRVVEDNVRDFLHNHPDLEVAVFCSHEGPSRPGRLRLEAENGIAVYRLSVARDVAMEWTPFDAANADPFERVLDHFRPDVIHFHCIQRLTATIVEVARGRGIPYIVTLHDAWWISDNQFLVDRDGLHLPGPDVIGDCAEAGDPVASVARRQRLAALLNDAHANLGVSAPFARIHADAGIARLQVIENGTPDIEPVQRQARADGRIALGHLGSRALHKGAALVEAALRQTAFDNLHLTIMDTALTSGQSIDTVWGNTPVSIVGPVPQSQVAQLYSRLDVLLAPSIWPESFGLVTREALSAGLWVVASDRGAIGQDVDEGRNGHIIDVADAGALIRVLARIDADPATYRASPVRGSAPRRSSEEQAAQLHRLYHEACRAVSREAS
ncbi:glycosyltransferase [Croceibacterium mercuriale]|uniref:glycosyltransferase n=1 Tax=Croceibacterium mercuriale TaxID=1572751 RepID=UPI00068BEA89|nr:glycosyltransferase [Croceibacterium mercuriale]